MVAQEPMQLRREGFTWDDIPLTLRQSAEAGFVESEFFMWTLSSTILLQEFLSPQRKDIAGSSPLDVPPILVYDTSLIATALVPVFNILRQ